MNTSKLSAFFTLTAVCIVSLIFGVHQCLAAGFYLFEVGTPGSLGTAGVANPVNTYTADKGEELTVNTAWGR